MNQRTSILGLFLFLAVAIFITSNFSVHPAGAQEAAVAKPIPVSSEFANPTLPPAVNKKTTSKTRSQQRKKKAIKPGFTGPVVTLQK